MKSETIEVATVFLSVALPAISFIVWLVRVQGVSNNNAKAIEQMSEIIKEQIKKFEENIDEMKTEANIHKMETGILKQQFQTVKEDIHEIKGSLKTLVEHFMKDKK